MRKPRKAKRPGIAARGHTTVDPPMTRRRPYPRLLWPGVALATLALVAAGLLLRRATPETAHQQWMRLAGGEPLDVVLITVDTLRADRLGCYGSERVATPNMDRLAAEGVRFANAASTVPFTLPAHSSLMTGTYPPYHGVRENVGYTLDSALPTLAEAMAAGGRSTGGFVSAFVLDSRWGIGRGFDIYYDEFDTQPGQAVNLGGVQRDGAQTIAAAARWLDGRPQRPLFLWLHLFEPHDPYTPPEPFSSRYPGRPYDAEVAWVDELIGRFLGELERRGLLETSLLILTADHGEGLGQHQEGFHGFFVYDSTVRVPLIVRPPFADLAGRVVEQPVSHVDLMPTILEAAGLPVPAQVQGRSLLGLLLGRDKEGVAERAVYAESMYPLLHYGWAPLRSLRTGRYKIIDAPRPELYDLAADPLEQDNVVLANRRAARELLVRLDAMVEAMESDAPTRSRQADMDEETLEQLRALGYLAGRGGVAIEDEDAAERADPKDRIGLHQLVMRAQSELGHGSPERARDLLRQAVLEDDSMVDAHQMLGVLALQEEEVESALEHFQAALRVRGDHPQAMFGLASTYRQLGRLEEALIGFQRLRELEPGDTKTELALADLLERLDRRPEAVHSLEQALARGSSSPILLSRLGELKSLEGDSRAAAALFERAVEANPELVAARFNLAVVYEEAGREDEAIALYESVLERAPRHYQARFNLGRLCGARGEFERQQQLWQDALEINPDFVRGYYLLAKLVMDRGGDLARAESLARQGLGRDPEHRAGPLGYYVLADILNRLGRSGEAAAALRAGRRVEAERG